MIYSSGVQNNSIRSRSDVLTYTYVEVEFFDSSTFDNSDK